MTTEGWTTRMRVLACLLASNNQSKSAITPQKWTREGIAERLQIDQSVVSRHLKSLVEEGMIFYDVRRVVGMNRRRKVPILSSLGAERLLEARQTILSTEVEIELQSGRVEARPLGALNHLWPDISITETLGLVEWLERNTQPIPLSTEPRVDKLGKVDETLVHWALEGAETRGEAIERAALMLTRNLSISALLRWQLEYLASEGSSDGWKPETMAGFAAEVTQFLIDGDWQNAPSEWSPMVDSASRLLRGEADARDLEIVRLAVANGAPHEWNLLLGEPPQKSS